MPDNPEIAAAEGPLPELVAGPPEGRREAVQARALLEKCERALSKASAEDKAELEKLMERVRVALVDRQWEKLKTASNELADVLFYLEDA
jgi:molecular chaperone DnaK